MSFQRVQPSSSHKRQILLQDAQTSQRGSSLPALQRDSVQEAVNDQAFEQGQLDTKESPLKEKFSSGTSAQPQPLSMRQALISQSQTQETAPAHRFNHSFATIPVHHQDASALPTRIQPKLTIGQPNDAYEQEADQVAKQAMRIMPSSTLSVPRWTGEETQPHRLINSITPLGPHKPVQAKQAAVASPDIEFNIERQRGGGRYLPERVRQPIEQAFGADFSHVRVHTDEVSNQLNQNLQSRAFTTGKDIFFKQGEYQPETQTGKELLMHELTHVVQQRGVLPMQQGGYTAGFSPEIHQSSTSQIQRFDVPSWGEIRRYAFTSLINGLRSIKSRGITRLRAWAAEQSGANQEIANGIVSAIDAVAEILLRLTLAISGLLVGFGTGIVQAVIGLIRLAVGIIEGILLFLYGFIDGGRRFDEWAHEVAEAISVLPEALSTLVDNWLTEFESASEEMQTIMIGELTGQILALIATFEFAAARAGSVPRIVVPVGNAAPRLAIAGGGARVGAGASVAVDVASPAAATALAGTYAMSVATEGGSGGGSSGTTPGGRRLTDHAQESLPRHGFREPYNLIDDIIENATRQTTQADGARVYIQRTGGRQRLYNLVIESNEGIVTAMRNLTPQELRNLGRNYGFDPSP